MPKGRKYTREEWNAIIALKKLGKTNIEIARAVGRNNKTGSIMKQINKFGGDYDKYLSQKKYAGKRATEQLMFEPPTLMPPKPKVVRKIPVKGAPNLDEWAAKKLTIATRQAIAIRNFYNELRSIGFKV